MKKPEPSPLEQLQGEAAGLAGDVREMLSLRWQLAKHELRTDADNFRRLACYMTTAAVMGLTALPLVLVAAARQLDGCRSIPEALWLVIFATVLLSAAALTAFFAWRRFRSRFIGLRETLDELREDLVWLEELRS